MAARGTEDEAEAAAAATTAMAAATASGAANKVLLVAGDIYRPAAIEQLQKLGESVGVEVFTLGKEVSPVDIVTHGLKYARDGGFDTVIVDTAGRQVSQQLCAAVTFMALAYDALQAFQSD
jgi:signal recognition particle subunit SRP54